MERVTLYHRTTVGEARQIMRRGFQDEKWAFVREQLNILRQVEATGVWLTDRVLEKDEGPPGDATLAVELEASEDLLQAYEIEGAIADGRLWVVPADLLNPRAKVSILSVDPRTSWSYEREELEEEEP